MVYVTRRVGSEVSHRYHGGRRVCRDMRLCRAKCIYLPTFNTRHSQPAVLQLTAHTKNDSMRHQRYTALPQWTKTRTATVHATKASAYSQLAVSEVLALVVVEFDVALSLLDGSFVRALTPFTPNVSGSSSGHGAICITPSQRSVLRIETTPAGLVCIREVDLTSGGVVATIPVSDVDPERMWTFGFGLLDCNADVIVVACGYTLIVFDRQTRRERRRVPLAREAWKMSLCQDNNTTFVLNFLGFLTVYDAATGDQKGDAFDCRLSYINDMHARGANKLMFAEESTEAHLGFVSSGRIHLSTRAVQWDCMRYRSALLNSIIVAVAKTHAKDIVCITTPDDMLPTYDVVFRHNYAMRTSWLCACAV